jgi:hypothetical protein
MPTVKFMGFVNPRIMSVGSSGGPFVLKDEAIGEVSMVYSISNDAINAECEITEVNDDTVTVLYWWVSSFIDGVVDAIAFSTGSSIVAVFDKYQRPNAPIQSLIFRDHELGKECSVSPEEIIDLSVKERSICKYLHDITHTLIRPLEATVNCARAIEGLSRLVAPGKDKHQRWKSLRDNLNLSEDYLKYISKLSEGPRHGDTGPQNTRNILETRRRTWVVMNRFLAFRKRNNAKLSTSEFPLL